MDPLTLQVLLVEDNPADVELVKDILDEERLQKASLPRFELVAYHSLSKAMAFLKETPSDIILLDLHLLDSHGLITFERLHQEYPQIPIVIITGLDDETLGPKAVLKGAQDYLDKSIDLESHILGHSLFYAWERHKFLSQLTEANEKVRKNEEGLRSIIEKHADPLLVVDAKQQIKFSNPAFNKLFPDPKKNLLEMPFQYPLEPNLKMEISINAGGKNFDFAMSVLEISWNNQPAFLVFLQSRL